MGYSRQTSPFQTPRGASGETSLAAAPAEASFRTGPSCHQVGVLGAQAARAFIVTIWSQFSSHSKNMLFHSITSFSLTLQPWRNALIGWNNGSPMHGIPFPDFHDAKDLNYNAGCMAALLVGGACAPRCSSSFAWLWTRPPWSFFTVCGQPWLLRRSQARRNPWITVPTSPSLR